MKYYKLKISLENYEDKLNRTILFNQNNDLDELAFTILSIFNTRASGFYKFEDDQNKYECEIRINQAEEIGDPNKGIDSYLVTLENLKMKNNKFTMTYDYEQNYKFIIEVLEEVELKENYIIARVIDGIGYGIIEDEKQLPEDFLDGKPINEPLYFFKNKRYKMVDFNSFTLDECNKKLKREIREIRKNYFIF